MFRDSHKAQVVCFIYFVKVKADVSESATVITKVATHARHLYDSKCLMYTVVLILCELCCKAEKNQGIV